MRLNNRELYFYSVNKILPNGLIKYLTKHVLTFMLTNKLCFKAGENKFENSEIY